MVRSGRSAGDTPGHVNKWRRGEPGVGSAAYVGDDEIRRGRRPVVVCATGARAAGGRGAGMSTAAPTAPD